MEKLVIVNRGRGEQGKSSSIKNVFDILSKKYPYKVYIGGGDIKATIQIENVLVGLESQGDPNSRQGESLNDFYSWGCAIIVCASRTGGETCDNVINLTRYGYQAIWTQNDRSDNTSLHSNLNLRYAERIVQMIEDRIVGKL